MREVTESEENEGDTQTGQLVFIIHDDDHQRYVILCKGKREAFTKSRDATPSGRYRIALCNVRV